MTLSMHIHYISQIDVRDPVDYQFSFLTVKLSLNSTKHRSKGSKLSLKAIDL